MNNKEMKERIKELEALLNECQFVDSSGGEYHPICPICNAAWEHFSDCRLAKALQK